MISAASVSGPAKPGISSTVLGLIAQQKRAREAGILPAVKAFEIHLSREARILQARHITGVNTKASIIVPTVQAVYSVRNFLAMSGRSFSAEMQGAEATKLIRKYP